MGSRNTFWKRFSIVVGAGSALVTIAVLLLQYKLYIWQAIVYIWQAVVWCWGAILVTLAFPVPLWTLVLAGVIAVASWRGWDVYQRMKSTHNPATPSAQTLPPCWGYESDYFYGVIWNWTLNRGDPSYPPQALCSLCENELDWNPTQYAERPPGYRFSCTHCGHNGILCTGSNLPHRHGHREVERRIRTGDWEGAVERLSTLRRERSSSRDEHAREDG